MSKWLNTNENRTIHKKKNPVKNFRPNSNAIKIE